MDVWIVVCIPRNGVGSHFRPKNWFYKRYLGHNTICISPWLRGTENLTIPLILTRKTRTNRVNGPLKTGAYTVKWSALTSGAQKLILQAIFGSLVLFGISPQLRATENLTPPLIFHLEPRTNRVNGPLKRCGCALEWSGFTFQAQKLILQTIFGSSVPLDIPAWMFGTEILTPPPWFKPKTSENGVIGPWKGKNIQWNEMGPHLGPKTDFYKPFKGHLHPWVYPNAVCSRNFDPPFIFTMKKYN